jgi:hypothetical protein
VGTSFAVHESSNCEIKICPFDLISMVGRGLNPGHELKKLSVLTVI